MNKLITFISQPWPWYTAGPIMALIMFLLLLAGNKLGISANLRTMCSIMGMGKNCEFFNFNWKDQLWNLFFAIGLILGGLIANHYLTDMNIVHISEVTITELNAMGIKSPGGSLAPSSIFSWESLLTIKGFIILVAGGFLVGFGTSYAGGCTTGHTISGLSELQLPSLIATMGFFTGGLLATYFILPYLLTL